jgi:hypothetical protein
VICAYCKKEIKENENMVWVNGIPYHLNCIIRTDTLTNASTGRFIIKTSYTGELND